VIHSSKASALRTDAWERRRLAGEFQAGISN